MNWPQIIAAALASGLVMFVLGRFSHALDRGEAKEEKTAGKIERVDDQARASVARVEKELGSRLGELENRVTAVEAEVDHLPTDEDVRRLVDRVSGVEVGVARLDAKMEGTGEMVRTIRDHLMQKELT